MKLRGVFFDYGMVLSTPAVPSAHQTLIELLGVPPDVFERCYWAHRHAYDAGRLDGRKYWENVAHDAGTSLTEQQLQKLIEADILMWSGINEPMLEWALHVGRSGLRTGILSNIGFELADALEAKFPWVQEFKYSIWSCRTGNAKPEPPIFQCAQKKIELPPEEILFIDDRADNIQAAQAAGFKGIVFTNISQLHADLAASGWELG